MKLTIEFVGVDKLALKESSTNELKINDINIKINPHITEILIDEGFTIISFIIEIL